MKLISTEMGKTLAVADWEMEVVIGMCQYYADNAEKFLQNKPVESEQAEKAYLYPQPLGVLLCIEPWNFPFYQVFRPATAGIGYSQDFAHIC